MAAVRVPSALVGARAAPALLTERGRSRLAVAAQNHSPPGPVTAQLERLVAGRLAVERRADSAEVPTGAVAWVHHHTGNRRSAMKSETVEADPRG